HPLLGAGVVAGTGAALAPRLPALPAWVSLRLTVRGHLHAGRQLAEAVRRAWWPLLALVAIRSPMARRALALAAVAARTPLRLLDDVAYSVGVWRGCRAEWSLAALRPVVVSWPARARRR
ncbi:MAG: hypothetical protein HKN41_02205, partial [Ilumatobacter sp.]|nr:hypothetical protein [Ilumatobacter sp.]